MMNYNPIENKFIVVDKDTQRVYDSEVSKIDIKDYNWKVNLDEKERDKFKKKMQNRLKGDTDKKELLIKVNTCYILKSI